MSGQLTPEAAELVQAPELEVTKSDVSQRVEPSVCYSSGDPLLPDGWRKTLPKADHQWVSQALFTANEKGKAKLDFNR